jgi:hypothetical protein
MTPANVLTVCEQRGVQLSVVGTELRARGRKGAVSNALRRGITEHKADLIELILARSSDSPVQPVDVELAEAEVPRNEANGKRLFGVGELVYPTTESGIRLHDEPSLIAESRRTEAGTWQYRMSEFTQWRDERLYALATATVLNTPTDRRDE